MADAKRTVVVEAKTKGVKESTKQVDELSESTESLVDNIEVMGVSVGDVRGRLGAFGKGIKAATTSVRAFGKALLATGIGAVVIGLTALATAFPKTEAGARFLNRASAALGATFNAVIRRFDQIIKGSRSILDFFNGLGDEITESADAAGNLADQTDRLTRVVAIFEGEQVKLKRELEAQRLIRDDERKSLPERIRAANEINRLLDQQTLAVQNLNTQQENAARTRLENVRGTSEETEAIVALNEVLRENADREEELLGFRAENLPTIIEFNKLLDEEKRIREEILRIQQEAGVFAVQAQQVETTGLTTLTKNYEAASKAILQKAGATEKDAEAILTKQQAEEASIQAGLAGLGALASAAGQSSAIGKALAIANATIASSLAIIKVFSDSPVGTPFFAKVAQAVALGANLAAQVRQITSTPVPKVEIQEGFAKGGFTMRNRSDSAVAGVVHANEYVVPAKLVRSAAAAPMIGALEGMRRNVKGYQAGGLVSGFGASDIQRITRQAARNEVQVPVLVVEDLKTTEDRVQIRENRGSFPGN